MFITRISNGEPGGRGGNVLNTEVKRFKLKRHTADKLFSLMLLLPAIITTTMFILVPVVDSIYRSFFDYRVRNIISGEPGVWNNFANYIKLFSNGKLVPSMINTLVFVFGVVLLSLYWEWLWH